MIDIRLIDIQDSFYPFEQELRNKILLRPLGIPDHAWEMHDATAWHFIGLDNNIVLGCVVLVPINPEKTVAQLMQMAVDTNQQGKGIGKLLVNALIAFAKAKGINEISLPC